MARGVISGLRRTLANSCAALLLLWRGARGPTGLMLVLAAVEGFAPTLSALGLRSLINGLVGHHRAAVVSATVVVIVGFVLVSFLMPVTGYAQTEVNRRLELLVSDELFAALNAVPRLDQFEQPAFLDQIRLAQQAGLQAPEQVADGVVSGVRAGVTLLGFAVALIQLDAWIALLALAAVVPGTVIGVRLSARRAAAEMALSPGRRRAFAYSMMQTDLRAAKEIRIFGLGEYLRGQMIEVLRSVTSAERRRDRAVLGWQLLLQLFGLMLFAGAIAIASRGVWAGRLQLGDLALVLASLAGIQAGVATINATLGQLTNTLALFDNYRRTVTAVPAAADPGQPSPGQPARLASLSDAITLRDVWFRYDPHGPWVLQGVDLTLPAGTATALVGVNGAGKSTLVKLLCGLYAPSRGELYWDDVPISEIDPEEHRRHISAVFQDFMTYDLTARQNIVLGDLARADDEVAVLAAAQAAGIHEALAALPSGYQTLLSRVFFDAAGARGASLSGGQWQRLAIARALMRAEPDLMILDEPSSGLDAEAEHQLVATLHALRRRQTSLLISHRLNTVVDADNIVVLAGGVIAEQGSHQNLLRAGGRYAEMFQAQAEGFRSDSTASER